MILWCTGAYELNWCKEKAKELQASGQFSKVTVRKLPRHFLDAPGKEYAHIYVERKPEMTPCP